MLALLIAVTSVSFSTALAEESTGNEAALEGSAESDTDTSTDIDTATTEDDNSTLPEETGDVDTDTTTEAVDDVDTTEEAASEDSGMMMPMALTPEGEMIAPDNLQFSFPAGAQFKDLAVASVTLTDIEAGTCQMGSPRFIFGLTDEQGGETQGYAFGYLADAGSFNDCTNDYALEGANLVGTAEGRWEVHSIASDGPMYKSWDQIVSSVGNYYVNSAVLVLEYGSLTPVEPTVQFTVLSEPGDLLAKLTVGFTVTGGTPEGNICFDLVNDASEEAVATKCFDTAGLDDDGAGALVFNGLVADDYTVVQSTTPAGYSTPAPVPITLNAGVNHTVQLDSALIPTTGTITVTLTSAAPEDADQLPDGSTWTLTDTADSEQSWTGPITVENVDFPVEFTLEEEIPFGTYELTIDAGSTFKSKTVEVVVEDPTVTVEIELTPTSLVDSIIQVLIRILNDILNGTGGE